MHTVTKATAIQFIDCKCHIMKQKSRKTALSGYYAITHVSRDLLLMASGADTHIHTHTDVRTKTISRNQARTAFGRVPGLKITLLNVTHYAVHMQVIYDCHLATFLTKLLSFGCFLFGILFT